MDDEIEARLRDHYRRAAQDILPDQALIRRAQQAGSARATVPWSRRYAMPLLAAAVTAGIMAAALLVWPRQQSVPTRPVERPAPILTRTPPPTPTRSPVPIRPRPDVVPKQGGGSGSEATPGQRPPGRHKVTPHAPPPAEPGPGKPGSGGPTRKPGARS